MACVRMRALRQTCQCACARQMRRRCSTAPTGVARSAVLPPRRSRTKIWRTCSSGGGAAERAVAASTSELADYVDDAPREEKVGRKRRRGAAAGAGRARTAGAGRARAASAASGRTWWGTVGGEGAHAKGGC